MAGSVILHVLAGKKKAVEACRLIERLYLAGKRVVVVLDDAGRAKILDDMLWTFSPASFVPHVLWDGSGEVDEPVAIVGGRVANPNGATVLVVVGTLAQPEAAAAFAEVHDFVAQLAEDAGKAATWREAGFAVQEVRGVGGR